MNILRISTPFSEETPYEECMEFLKKEPPTAQQNVRLLGDGGEDKMMKRPYSAGLSENMLTQA